MNKTITSDLFELIDLLELTDLTEFKDLFELKDLITLLELINCLKIYIYNSKEGNESLLNDEDYIKKLF